MASRSWARQSPPVVGSARVDSAAADAPGAAGWHPSPIVGVSVWGGISKGFGLDREGTRLTFRPVGWPGFTPEGRFVVTAREGSLADVAGNVMAALEVTFRGTIEVREDDSPRVPETVFVELDTNSDGVITRPELLDISRQFYRSDDVEAAGNILFAPIGA